jgi:hypothetical protein
MARHSIFPIVYHNFSEASEKNLPSKRSSKLAASHSRDVFESHHIRNDLGRSNLTMVESSDLPHDDEFDQGRESLPISQIFSIMM